MDGQNMQEDIGHPTAESDVDRREDNDGDNGESANSSIANSPTRRCTRFQTENRVKSYKLDESDDDPTDKSCKKSKKNHKGKEGLKKNRNTDIINCTSVIISKSDKYFYENIEVPGNMADRYPNKPIEMTSEDENEKESPESQKIRIEMIARQGRLHPSNKKYNQGPVEKPPLITPGIMVGYTPAGQRHEVDLNFERPTWFNSEYARIQFDDATTINVKRMMHDLETGHFLPNSLDADVERKYFAQQDFVTNEAKEHLKMTLVKQRRRSDLAKTTEWRSLIETENKLIKLIEYAAVRLKDFPNEVSKQLDVAQSLKMSPLMFKKSPEVLETVGKLARQKKYGNVSKSAQVLLWKIQGLFEISKSCTFNEFFSSEVGRFAEKTKDMSLFDIVTMTEEPTEQDENTTPPEQCTMHPEQAPELEVQEENVTDIDDTSFDGSEWIPVNEGYWADIIDSSAVESKEREE